MEVFLEEIYNCDNKNLFRFLRDLIDRPDNIIKVYDYESIRKVTREEVEAISKWGITTSTKATEHRVFINERLENDKKLFVLSHELAHVFFGHSKYPRICPDYVMPEDKRMEFDCNLLAAILMFVINGALPIMEHYELLLGGSDQT